VQSSPQTHSSQSHSPHTHGGGVVGVAVAVGVTIGVAAGVSIGVAIGVSVGVGVAECSWYGHHQLPPRNPGAATAGPDSGLSGLRTTTSVCPAAGSSLTSINERPNASITSLTLAQLYSNSGRNTHPGCAGVTNLPSWFLIRV
jgi:hypothetical protein